MYIAAASWIKEKGTEIFRFERKPEEKIVTCNI